MTDNSGTLTADRRHVQLLQSHAMQADVPELGAYPDPASRNIHCHGRQLQLRIIPEFNFPAPVARISDVAPTRPVTPLTLHSSKLAWKSRGAHYKTTTLYIGASMGFHVNLREDINPSIRPFIHKAMHVHLCMSRTYGVQKSWA